MKRWTLMCALAVLAGCSVENKPDPRAASAVPQRPADTQVIPDDTDDVVTGKVSGLVLFTDFGTGCQYLATQPTGALTPRLGEDGRPKCDPALRRKQR
jgi:hypothetical protein